MNQNNNCSLHQNSLIEYCCINGSCKKPRLLCHQCIISDLHSAHNNDLIQYSHMNRDVLEKVAQLCEKTLAVLQGTFDSINNQYQYFIRAIRWKYIISEQKFANLQVKIKEEAISQLLKFESLKEKVEKQLVYLPVQVITLLKQSFEELQLDQVQYINPEDNSVLESNLLMNQGIGLYSEGKYEEARQKFDQSLYANPQNIQSLCILGETLMKLNDFEEALKSFRRATALQSTNIKAQFEICKCLVKQGKRQLALEQCLIVLELDNNFQEANAMLDQLIL